MTQGTRGVNSAAANVASHAEKERIPQYPTVPYRAPGNEPDAHTRVDLNRWADEQSALRRVAELVARTASAHDVFAAVATEASSLLRGEATTLTRFEDEFELIVEATHHGPAPIGIRITFEPDTLPDRVRRSGSVARVDDYTQERDSRLAADFGLTAAVSAPITVGGQVWGMLTATSDARPLPDGAEFRLEQFAQLVAAALANSQARADLRALADEQAALRRVAELVARGEPLDEVFAAVATETSILLGDRAVALLRSGPDDAAIVVAVRNSLAPLGSRIPLQAGTAPAVLTGKSYGNGGFDATPVAERAGGSTTEVGVSVPITVEGRVWGALSSSLPGSRIPVGAEDRLAPFAELAAAAITNAENKAKLTASRARVVATADETRRRLQRDVHDSAQQRLVHTIIALKLARDEIAAGGTAAALVDEALRNAEQASRELRNVVRGILPASLIRGGLRSGVESLVADLAIPVGVRIAAPRLPAQTETTAFFLVAEALTNVVKHAHATRATVEVTLQGDFLAIDVRDDGVGGADPDRGTGLTGLLDRVDAAEGMFTVTSPTGHGTAVHAALPLRQAASLWPSAPGI